MWIFYTSFGAGDRTRTGDINLGKVALYQLSYSREGGALYGFGWAAVNLFKLDLWVGAGRR